MAELKAVRKLEDVHLAQAKNYLEAYNMETGLLINFGQEILNLKGYSTILNNPVNHRYNPIKILVSNYLEPYPVNPAFFRIRSTGSKYNNISFLYMFGFKN